MLCQGLKKYIWTFGERKRKRDSFEILYMGYLSIVKIKRERERERERKEIERKRR